MGKTSKKKISKEKDSKEKDSTGKTSKENGSEKKIFEKKISEKKASENFSLEKKLSITQKLMISYASLLLVVLLLILFFVLPMQTGDMKSLLEEKLLETTQILSKDPEIQAAVMAGTFSEELIDRMDSIMADSSHTGFIVICDAENKRLYHPNPQYRGEYFMGGDEKQLFEGVDTYISIGPGTASPQFRAFHSIKKEDGTIAGFVIASDTLESVKVMKRQVVLRLILICVGAFVLGMLMAYAIIRNLRHILLGNDPPTFARMFLQREDILNHLSEGILAFDESRLAVYKNSAGSSFYPSEKMDKQNILSPDYESCLTDQTTQTGLTVELAGKSYLASVIPVVREGLFHIVMIILRDRTEVVRLTEQMDGTNHIVDALRANTHEFMNKLHVISGLLQVGETQKALSLIGDISEEVDQGYQTVVALIQNRAVAALILGKMSHAKEQNIHFVLRPDSFLPAETPLLTTGDLVTLIGNLLENAFDAINGTTGPRQVELFVGCGEEGISISVDDTGCGMDETTIQKIRSGRYSAKGAGHGYGMWLIQNIVETKHGYLQIDSEPGEGSSISIIISAKGEAPLGSCHDS